MWRTLSSSSSSSSSSWFVIAFMPGTYNYTPGKKPCLHGIYCCSCSLVAIYGTCNIASPSWMPCTFTSVLCEVCVPCPIWLFAVVLWFRASLICCSGVLWTIFGWFQLPLLLLVSCFSFIFYIRHMFIVRYLYFRLLLLLLLLLLS